MNYYAHTAEDSEARTLYTLKDGRQMTEKLHLSELAEEQVGWQALKTHLINVAEKARNFARPFGLTEEARLAGTAWHLASIQRMP